MIQVVTGEYGREEKIFLVPDGVDIKIAPQAPTGGRQEILWITNEDGDTVAAFASWRAAVYVPGDGFRVAKNPLLPRDNNE